jgi:hypothetical protein
MNSEGYLGQGELFNCAEGAEIEQGETGSASIKAMR